jgi:hypothetical protein
MNIFLANLIVLCQDKNGLVSLLENKRHDLEDGDFVSFSDVKGMTELNNADLTFKITVKSKPFCFISPNYSAQAQQYSPSATSPLSRATRVVVSSPRFASLRS